MVAYGGICSDIDRSPTDMERLTTYLTAYGGICSDIDRFTYRHGTSNDVWRLFPTLIVFPTDIERLTTYGGVWRVVIFRPSNNMLICRHDIVCP